jgi:hypothetical protein
MLLKIKFSIQHGSGMASWRKFHGAREKEKASARETDRGVWLPCYPEELSRSSPRRGPVQI